MELSRFTQTRKSIIPTAPEVHWIADCKAISKLGNRVGPPSFLGVRECANRHLTILIQAEEKTTTYLYGVLQRLRALVYLLLNVKILSLATAIRVCDVERCGWHIVGARSACEQANNVEFMFHSEEKSTKEIGNKEFCPESGFPK
eukprot:4158141-Amphidinium_carterae.1